MDPEIQPSSRKTWTLIIITIVSILIFGIAITLYFIFFNTPATHSLTITNTTNENITVSVSSLTDSVALPEFKLSPGSNRVIYATPGADLSIEGATENNPVFLTKAVFRLAGGNFSNNVSISDGTTTLNGLLNNNLNTDEYGVSMREGYNIPINISITTPRSNLIKNPEDIFWCESPTWYSTVSPTGQIYPCPPELQDGPNCITPCNNSEEDSDDVSLYCCTEFKACEQPGGCENSWPNIDYYYVFAAACPNCMITNCDTPNYKCAASNQELVNYNIKIG